MSSRKATWELRTGFAILMLVAPFAGAQSAPEISAEPVPGQLEVMQGTAIKLGSTPPTEGPQPEGYHWDIVQGQGGTLYNEDQYEAIFQAPKISASIELFVIRLTVAYPGAEPAHATVHIRVHRDMPQVAPKTEKKKEKSIEQVMDDYYRREKDAREANKQRVKESQSRVVGHTVYRGFHGGYGWGGPGWGWGYGWGWPAYYPVYAPVVIPPPGIDYGPGDGHWDLPTAIPYDEVVTTFPEDIANDYLPQDYPGAEPVPDMGYAGGSPTDFIDIPAGAGRGGQAPVEDPGFMIESEIVEPMIDPGFGYDDMDW